MCVFTSAHPLDDVRVATKFATSFLAAGFRVTWIGPQLVAHGQHVGDPRIAYLTQPAPRSRAQRFLGLARQLRAARSLHDVDWWYVPDPDAALALSKIRKLLSGRIIFDVHEVFHTGHMDSWVGPDRLPKLRELVRRAIRSAAAGSDILVGVSDAVLDPYRSKRTASRVVANFAPSWFADDVEPSLPPAAGVRFFHGNLTAGNGGAVVADAFRLLHENGAAGDSEMVFMASQDSTLMDRVSRWTAERPDLGIRVLHRRPHIEMPALMRSCDVGLVAYGRDLGAASFPNRLFEYMACGLAVLAPSYSPLIAEVLTREGIGLTADFEDAAQVASAMARFIAHRDQLEAMKSRARTAFLAEYNWQHEFDGLLRQMGYVERSENLSAERSRGNA